jgi:flagellar M-ring protein FliF
MAANGLEQLLQQGRALVASVGRGRAIAAGVIFVVIVGGVIGASYWASQPTWALLATDVDAEGMNGVVERLKALKVDYVLDEGGRTVRVDAARVDELRLQLAAEGLPASGRIGFELFDRTMFGATELTEKVNFQRALEGELARTIGSLATVAAARVHLALPRTSLFSEQAQPAKASVVVRLASGRALSASEVDGIVGLVSSSVEGLTAEGVTVLDTTGRRLSRTFDPAETATDRGRFERQQQIERDLAARVVALLEPVVGAGRVRANVSATLRADAEDVTEERWDPTSVVRSRQSTMEADGRSVATGPAGARANLPKDGADAPAPLPTAANNRTSEVTNYEVSKLTRRTVSPPGQLERLSVAVLVDGVRKTTRGADGTETSEATPRSVEELQRLHALVASAVGMVPDRGDQLTVENISFDMPELDVPVPVSSTPAARPLSQRLREDWRTLAPAAAAVLLAIAGLVIAMRWRRGRATAVALPARLASASGAPIPGIPRGDSDDADPLGSGAVAPSAARQIARLAQTEPEQLARIVRGWLAEEERER